MMNTVRKSENLLPFPVISAAANGDTTAMCAILKHYEGYIAKLCTRTLKDDAGNTYGILKIFGFQNTSSSYSQILSLNALYIACVHIATFLHIVHGRSQSCKSSTRL